MEEQRAMDNTFPYDLDGELGEIRLFSQECPGVYFLSCVRQTDSRLCDEFYIVEESAPSISRTVKQMGRRLASNPHLLAYDIQDVSGGQKLVAYEAGRYRAANGLAPSDGAELHSIAVDGMETNPEYFGTFPVPCYTPWGYTMRHKAIDNGVYWIETGQCRRVLAVCYTLHDELSDTARLLSVQECRDREAGLDNTMGYLFFSEEASCIPIFELLPLRRQWEYSGIINRRALENAVWHFFPEYAAGYNMQEASGQHDLTGLLINSLGGQADLTIRDKEMIAMSSDTDIHFCTLME